RTNARAVQRLRSGDGLAAVIWAHRPRVAPPETAGQVPTRSPESAAMAKALKSHGLTFVGPVSCFALAEAAGLVDTHLVGCHRRGRAAAISSAASDDPAAASMTTWKPVSEGSSAGPRRTVIVASTTPAMALAKEVPSERI